MVIDIIIKNDKLICKKENIVAGCKNYYTLKAGFSEDWDELDKFLTIAGISPPIAFNEDNEVILPLFYGRELNIAILGKKNDEIIAATNYHTFYSQPGAKEDYSSPPAPDASATWATYLGNVANDEIERISNVYSGKLCGFTWYVDTDEIVDRNAKVYGTLKDCMTKEFAGTWFYVITSTSDKGSASCPAQYEIDGANGRLSLRGYVVWMGNRLVHIPILETITEDMLAEDLAKKINSGGSAEIADGSITVEKIADNSITEDKLDSDLRNKITTIIETNKQILSANAVLESTLNGGDV